MLQEIILFVNVDFIYYALTKHGVEASSKNSIPLQEIRKIIIQKLVSHIKTFYIAF